MKRKKKTYTITALIAVVVFVVGVSVLFIEKSFPGDPTEPFPVPEFDEDLITTIPLPEKHFVQGMEFDPDDNNILYISSGGYGGSYLVKYRYDQEHQILSEQERFYAPDEMFLEGLTIRGNSLYVLTWREGIVYELDKHTLEEQQTYSITGEGWGICYHADTDRFWLSNGSENLVEYDREFRLISLLPVGVANLNELECSERGVLANVWLEEHIVHIALSDDTEEKIVSERFTKITEIYGERGNDDSVLNGVALRRAENNTSYDREELWVAGKNFTHILVFDKSSLKFP